MALNDNVNLMNNFTFENKNQLKNVDHISFNSSSRKAVADYCIIKNNEKWYQLAYPKNNDEYFDFRIMIYNLISQRIGNKIKNAHLSYIYILKQYYNSYSKNHILLSSSGDKPIKLWDISSNPIINILTIDNCFDGEGSYSFSLMFKNEKFFFIFGGSQCDKKKYGSKREL